MKDVKLEHILITGVVLFISFYGYLFLNGKTIDLPIALGTIAWPLIVAYITTKYLYLTFSNKGIILVMIAIGFISLFLINSILVLIAVLVAILLVKITNKKTTQSIKK